LSEVACPSCAAPNPAGNRFCGSCGSAMELGCPSCGSANPAGNRFCGSCGGSLDASTPDATPLELEERKVVSMVFADLTASTEMASRLDPEDLRAVLRPFYDAMVEEIDRYGGTVEKFIGDAIVAAFGAPVAHEDDPERSIRCALAMHRRLAELNTDLAERAGGDLVMRIGINTGEVIAHSIEEGIVTGEAVNIAARLQALAEPGRVVVGERTYRHARHAFAFEDLGGVNVKGIERPLHVFAVQGAIAAPREIGGAFEARFVGRGGELDLLRLLYERTVREARPNLVTVVGPPGIGKSRLSYELARALGGRGARVVRGRCLPYGDGLTYWPLAEIVKADAGILDSDPPEAVLRKAQERLDPWFPGEEAMGTTAVLLSSIGIEQTSDPLAGTERDAAQRQIARAWQRYLESMASFGPLVALIEDLHWADPILLELIETVVSRAGGPALILCSARPELFERRPDWGGGLSNATTLSLSPLSATDGAELIEDLLDGRAPAEVVGPILHRSEGNPFFAGELLRMMVEDGTLSRRDGRWTLVRELPSTLPDTVQGVIASRIDLLEPDEKRAIQDASVIGRHFWVAGVERLGAPSAERAIESLVAKGLVGEQEGSSIEGEREFVFNHILTRDVAYAGIPKARRVQAHAIVGAWIEEGTQGRAEEFAEILAHHFSLAGDEDRTARYALLAGQRLLRVFAAEDAIAWFDRAMDAAGSAGPGVRAQVALARGGAREQLGRFEDARVDFEYALSEARDAGDAASEARALAATAHVLWLLDRYDEGSARLPEALERARAVGLADVEARLLYTAGTLRFGRGEFGEAIPLHDRALEVASKSGDLEGQALAHHGLCESYFFHGPFEEGLSHGLQADRILRDLGQRSMVAHNAYMVGWALAFAGRPDEAFETADGSVAMSREIGNRRDEAFGLYNRGEILLAQGRIEEARVDAERAVAIFRELRLPRGELVGLCLLDEVVAEPWDLETLSQRAGAALAISDALGGTFFRPMALASDGLAALASGDVERGDRRFTQASSADALLEVCWVARTEVLAREWTGDAPGLARVGARIQERVLPSAAYWGAWGPYARALAALLEGRHDEALDGATTSLELASSYGERRLVWRAGRIAWRSLEAMGRTDEAEASRRRAAAVARDFAAASTGRIREGFLARRDVAELLG